jgi:hypothetical protein
MTLLETRRIQVFPVLDASRVDMAKPLQVGQRVNSRPVKSSKDVGARTPGQRQHRRPPASHASGAIKANASKLVSF